MCFCCCNGLLTCILSSSPQVRRCFSASFCFYIVYYIHSECCFLFLLLHSLRRCFFSNINVNKNARCEIRLQFLIGIPFYWSAQFSPCIRSSYVCRPIAPQPTEIINSVWRALRWTESLFTFDRCNCSSVTCQCMSIDVLLLLVYVNACIQGNCKTVF